MDSLIHLSIFASLGLLLYFRFKQNQRMEMLFKPLTITLIFLLPISVFGWSSLSQYSLFIVGGLFFSIWGDTALMFEKRFNMGMLCFLITHIFYLQAIFVGNTIQYTWIILPVLFIWLLSQRMIVPVIPTALMIPVIVYSLVLTFLLWQTIEQTVINPTRSFQFFLMGILLFAASDWNLIINKFKPTKTKALTLPVYFVGQWLIALSAITV